jgi:hypothetical protein
MSAFDPKRTFKYEASFHVWMRPSRLCVSFRFEIAQITRKETMCSLRQGVDDHWSGHRCRWRGEQRR